MPDNTEQNSTSRLAHCSCGQLSVSTQGNPIRISICHCYACQRRTGSAFGVQARFHYDNVRISGDSQRYTRASDEGNSITFFFCPNCGSTVYYRLDQTPGIIAVPIGAFAESDFPEPTVSVYEEHQHAWFNLINDVEHYK